MIAELSLIPILVLYFFILDLFCLILYSLSIPPYFLFIFSTYTLFSLYFLHLYYRGFLYFTFSVCKDRRCKTCPAIGHVGNLT